MTYCSYGHFILFLRSRTVGGNECHLTFLEVAGKTGCFPATSCAPKYVFTHYIGINSPFLSAINLFIILFCLLPTPMTPTPMYGNKRHPIQSKKDEEKKSKRKALHGKLTSAVQALRVKWGHENTHKFEQCDKNECGAYLQYKKQPKD